jgi:hypothetical protein
LSGLRSIGGYSGNKAVATYALIKGRQRFDFAVKVITS